MEYYSNQAVGNISVFLSSNIMIYSFRIVGGTELTPNIPFLTFTNKIKIKANIIGVVDSTEFAIMSDIQKNNIYHASSFTKTLRNNAHCFGITFIEQC